MASPTLKFKRGAFADLPTLAVGEPGFTTDKYQLFVGSPAGNQLIGGGNFWDLESTTAGGAIKLYEGTNNGTNYVELKSPDALGSNVELVLPSADATASGQVLQSNASGVLSFGEVALTHIDIDGGTDIGAAIVDADLFIVDDGASGTNRKTTASRIKSYVLGGSSGGTFSDITVGSAVTISVSGIDAGAAGIITAATFDGNLTGNVTGTILTASQPNITAVGTLGSLDVTNNITVGGTVDGRDVLDDGQAGDNLITLSGVARDATNLGTFSGSTIADSETIKGALQDLETELESIAGGAAQAGSVAVGATDANSTHFVTFVSDNNTNPTQENVRTDAGIAYNPSTNIMTVGEVSVTTLDIGGTNVTATATELNVLDGVTSFLDEDNMASNSATSIPSQQSVKAYVDSSVAGVAVTFALDADSGTAGIVTTGTTLSVNGTANEIETSVAFNSLTIGLPNTVNITTELDVPTIETGAIQAKDGTAALTIADSTGKVTASGAVDVNSTLTAAAGLVVQGSTDLGDQTSDTITVVGRFDSGLVPSTDGVRDLGSLTLAWDEGHINHLDGVSANVTGISSANQFKGATLAMTGGGTFGGNVEISGNLSVGGSVTNIDVEDLRIVSPVIELGLERLGDGTLQPPSAVTNTNSGVVMYYNHVGVNSTNAKIAAMFAKIKNGGDMRIGFATDVTITKTGAGDSVASVNHMADIEARGLFINDCAGVSQVISCTGNERFLENITVDGGSFS